MWPECRGTRVNGLEPNAISQRQKVSIMTSKTKQGQTKSKREYVCVFLNSILPLGLEFFAQGDKSNAKGSMSPKAAKRFSSKAEAQEWAAAFLPDLIDNISVTKYSKEWEKSFEGWLSNGATYRSFPDIDKGFNVAYDSLVHTNEDVLEWRIKHIKFEPPVSQENYESWPSLYEVFDYIDGLDGYMEENEGEENVSVVIKLRVSRNGNLKGFKGDLALARKHCDIEKGSSEQVFEVSSGAEARGGLRADTHLFKIKDGNRYEIVRGSPTGNNQPLVSTKDISELFGYWQKNLAYKAYEDEGDTAGYSRAPRSSRRP